MKDFSGVFTALITPFKAGEIDWVSLKRVLRAQLDGGINGIVVSGTTGESPTLTDEEKQKLFTFIKSEVAGQIPLVMGTGTNSTVDTVNATKQAAALGADAALVVVPYYNKPPQRGLFQHFAKVAACSELPIILYNVPGRTITRLEVQTIAELSQLPNIIGVKDATGDLAFGAATFNESKPGFLLTSGDDGTFLELIRVGGQGVISVASNFMPKQFADWCARARKGDVETLTEFAKIRDLNNHLYVEANPIPVKTAMKLMGLIESAELRLPLVELAEPHMLALSEKMTKAGLL